MSRLKTFFSPFHKEQEEPPYKSDRLNAQENNKNNIESNAISGDIAVVNGGDYDQIQHFRSYILKRYHENGEISYERSSKTEDKGNEYPYSNNKDTSTGGETLLNKHANSPESTYTTSPASHQSPIHHPRRTNQVSKNIFHEQDTELNDASQLQLDTQPTDNYANNDVYMEDYSDDGNGSDLEQVLLDTQPIDDPIRPLDTSFGSPRIDKTPEHHNRQSKRARSQGTSPSRCDTEGSRINDHEDERTQEVSSKKRACTSIYIGNTKHNCDTLSSLSLQSGSLTIHLSKVRIICDLHSTSCDSNSIDSSAHDTSDIYYRDGPLGRWYDVVLSMEIIEFDDLDDDSLDSLLDCDQDREPSSVTMSQRLFVRQSAQRAFQNHVNHPHSSNDHMDNIDRSEMIRRVKKNMKPRRIKLFLYNKYARYISKYLKQAELQKVVSNSNIHAKAAWMDILLLSLNDCPSSCIFPFQPPSSFATKPSDAYLEDMLALSGYGRLSKHCICIGDTSKLQINVNINADGQNNSEEHMGFDQDPNSANDSDATQWSLQLFHTYDKTKFSDCCDESGIHGSKFKKILINRKNVVVDNAIYGRQRQNNLSHQKSPNNLGDISRTETMINQFISRIHHKNRHRHASVGSNRDGGCNSNSSNKTDGIMIGTSSIGLHNTTTSRGTKLSSSYTKLGDLFGIAEYNKTCKGKKAKLVDIYAIVLSIKPPSQTKGKDWSMKLSLIDDSLPILDRESSACITNESSSNGLNRSGTSGTEVQGTVPKSNKKPSSVILNMFLRDETKFPNVLMAGDVIRGHRVEPNAYNDQIFLVGRKLSSFIVFRPKQRIVNKIYKAKQCEWPSILSTDREDWEVENEKSNDSSLSLEAGKEMWLRGLSRLAGHPIVHEKFANSIQNIIPEADISDTKTFKDWVVMISAVIQGSPDKMSSSPRGYLRVWDGTGPPDCDPFCSDETVRHNTEPSIEAIVSVSNIIDCINMANDYGQSESIPKPKSFCGRIVNVVIWEDKHWESIIHSRCTSIGSFICMRNVSVRKRVIYGRDCYDLVLDKFASITPLPSITFEIEMLLRRHYKRISKNDPFNPHSACLPLQIPAIEHDYNGPASFSKAWKRLSHPPCVDHYYSLIECMVSKAPSKFPVIFQVHRILSPNNTMSDCATDQHDSTSINLRDLYFDKNGKKEFQFVILIHDTGIDLQVIVPNSVAEAIMGVEANILHSRWQTESEMKQRATHSILNLMKGLKSGVIRSVTMNKVKYFCLESIQPIF